MYFILNVCYIPFIPLSSKSSTFFQIFRGRNGRNEFLPLSSTRPEESHFFRKKLNPADNTSSNAAPHKTIYLLMKRHIVVSDCSMDNTCILHNVLKLELCTLLFDLFEIMRRDVSTTVVQCNFNQDSNKVNNSLKILLSMSILITSIIVNTVPKDVW